MAKIAYFDCPTGISGDMCLGALVDAGVPLDYLDDQLARLGISDEYTLRAEIVQRNGQRATKFHVDLTFEPGTFSFAAHSQNVHPNSRNHLLHSHSHSHGQVDDQDHDYSHPHDQHDQGYSPDDGDGSVHPPHPNPVSIPHQASELTSQSSRQISPFPAEHPPIRYLAEIETLIQSAQLTPRATDWSLAIFRQLAEAEGAVHGVPPSQVHFHEVGATDAIADIVGTCIGLDWLAIDQLYCSALPTGGGTVWASHGRLPVPVPAVLHLLQQRQVPIYSNGISKELVTPTGVAIATTLATAFGNPPAMNIHTIGLGAGSQNLALPNILRLWIGEANLDVQVFTLSKTKGMQTSHHADQPQPLSPPYKPELTTQTITILETQIDDLNPQIIGYVFDQLFAAGALDVFTQAIGMKKSRPGILLTVICLPKQVDGCEQIIYRETTTLGIRRRQQARSLLHRNLVTVSTPYGDVLVKVASVQPGTAVVNIKPEYEDCARLAQHHQIPWSEVYQAALQAWEDRGNVGVLPHAEGLAGK